MICQAIPFFHRQEGSIGLEKILGSLMAPDLEKRRQELRRGSNGTLDHVNDHLGMLLQLRCAGGPADLHRHGN